MPSSNYPAQLDTDQDLAVAVNNFSAKLSGAVSATDAAWVLSTFTATPVVNMLLTVDREIVQVLSVASNLVTVARGLDGTVADAHKAGALVEDLFTAWHHNVLADAVKKLETSLGPNLVNIAATSPVVSSKRFNFPPIAIGGALIAGANTISVPVIPDGVNGTNLSHYVWISGGTGTPEAALIVGGSGRAGDTNGQLIIQCANSHSGAWTLASATAGIQEAIASFGAWGGAVYVPAGDYTMHAPVTFLYAGTTLYGDGGSSLLRAGSSSMTFVQNRNVVGFSMHQVRDLYFVGADFPGVNAITGIAWTLAQKNVVERCIFNNVHRAVTFDRVDDTRLGNIDLIDNSQIWWGSTVDGPIGYSWNADLQTINHYASAPLGALGSVVVFERVAGGVMNNFATRNLYGSVNGVTLKNDTQGFVLLGGDIVTPATGIELLSSTVGATLASPLQTTLLGIQVDQYATCGLFVGGGSLYTGIVEPVITGANIAGAENHAIYIGQTTVGTAVHGGRIQNVKKGNGVTIDNGAHDVIVDGMQFTCQLDGADIYVVASSTTTNVRIANNMRGSTDSSNYIANGATSNTALVRGNSGVDGVEGAGLVAASVLTPTNPVHRIGGTATISTINLPTSFTVKDGFALTFIPIGLWATDLAGNIAIASTAVVGKAMTFTYLSATGKWYPSY